MNINTLMDLIDSRVNYKVEQILNNYDASLSDELFPLAENRDYFLDWDSNWDKYEGRELNFEDL